MGLFFCDLLNLISSSILKIRFEMKTKKGENEYWKFKLIQNIEPESLSVSIFIIFIIFIFIIFIIFRVFNFRSFKIRFYENSSFRNRDFGIRYFKFRSFEQVPKISLFKRKDYENNWLCIVFKSTCFSPHSPLKSS